MAQIRKHCSGDGWRDCVVQTEETFHRGRAVFALSLGQSRSVAVRCGGNEPRSASGLSVPAVYQQDPDTRVELADETVRLFRDEPPLLIGGRHRIVRRRKGDLVVRPVAQRDESVAPKW